MNFHNHLFDKVQEDLERQRDDFTRDFICEQYEIADVEELSLEQREEIEKFMDSSECPDFWVPGFEAVVNDWCR